MIKLELDKNDLIAFGMCATPCYRVMDYPYVKGAGSCMGAFVDL